MILLLKIFNMWKQELKQELELYKNINNELTARICFLILWKEKYIEATKKDWKDEEKIEKEIEIIEEAIEITKEKLNTHYNFN